MSEVLTESQCKILASLASDSELVCVKPPKAGFYFVVPLADAKAARTDRRVGHKYQAKVVDRLTAAGFLKPLLGASFNANTAFAWEITERGKHAAKEIANETRHPTGGEMHARRSRNARA